LQALTQLKADLESRGEAFDSRFYRWNRRFLRADTLETKHSVDEDMIAEYFPLQKTTRGILRIFETLFGLVFKEINQAEVCQDNVRLFSVWDCDDIGGDFRGICTWIFTSGRTNTRVLLILICNRLVSSDPLNEQANHFQRIHSLRWNETLSQHWSSLQLCADQRA
jgi:hypothetical protein